MTATATNNTPMGSDSKTKEVSPLPADHPSLNSTDMLDEISRLWPHIADDGRYALLRMAYILQGTVLAPTTPEAQA